jgi:hypothetical protein
MTSITGNIIENISGSLNGGISLTGNMTIINKTQDVIINGNTSVGNNFLNNSTTSTVYGNISSSSVLIKGPIDISGNVIGNISGDISDNIINVIGNVYAGNTNNVFNNFELLGDMNVLGKMDLSGNMNIGKGNLTIDSATGDTNILGTLGVNGATSLNSSLEVGGYTNLNSTLGVSGNVNVNNNFTINSATGNTNVLGTLGVAGATNLSSLNVSGLLEMTGDLNLNGNMNVNNKFTVDKTTGNTSISGNLDLSGNMNIANNKFTVDKTSGNTNILGTLGVSNNLDLSGNLNINNKFTVDKTTGNTNTLGTLGVSGLSTLNNTTISGPLNVNNTNTQITSTGTIGLNGNNMNLIGTSTLISSLTPNNTVSTLASLTVNTNGGIATDSSGNIYFCNTSTNQINKVTPAGVVSVFIGSGLNTPFGITIVNNIIYVCDMNNFRVLSITLSGTITVIAGGTNGITGGNGTSAKFVGPKNIISDSLGNLFVTDVGTNNADSNYYVMIRKIDTNFNVTTLVGGVRFSPFNMFSSITCDSNNNLYAGDENSNIIFKITPAGVYSVYADYYNNGISGTVGITIDNNNNLYASNFFTNTILKITINNFSVTTIAGNTSGYVDGVGTSALFKYPRGLTYDKQSQSLFILDDGNKKIRKMILFNTVYSNSGGVIGISGEYINMTGPTTITGNSNTTGNTNISGNLDCSGNVSIGLNKFNITSSSGNTTVGGTLGVTGNTTVGGTLGISGNTILGNTLSVSGNTTLGNTLNVTGNSTLNGTLNVNGDTTLNSSLINIGASNSTINIGNSSSTVNILGTTNLIQTNNLQVTDNLITLNKNGALGSAGNSGIEIEENSVITGYIKVANDRNSYNVKIPSNNTIYKLAVTEQNGDVNIAGNNNITGALNVTGNSNLSSLNANGNAGISGNLDLSGNLNIANNKFTVASNSGNTNILGTLGVTGTSTLNNTTISGNANIGGTLQMGTPSLFSLSKIDVAGSATFRGATNTRPFIGLQSGNTSVMGMQIGTNESLNFGYLNGNDFTNNLYISKYNGIGINNSNPAYTLDVSGIIHVNNSGPSLIAAANNPIYPCAFIDMNGYNLNGRALFGVDGYGYGNISTGATLMASWTYHPVIIATNTTEKMRITPDGKVGINNTNPQAVLDVNGNAIISGTSTLNNTSIGGTLNVTGSITSAGNNTWNGTNYFTADANFNNVNTTIRSTNQIELNSNIIDISGSTINIRNIPSAIKTNVLYYDNSTKAISYGLAASSTLNSSSNVLDYSYNMVLYDPLVTSQSYSPSIIQKYRSKWSSSPSVLLTLSQVGGTAYGQSCAVSRDGSIIAVGAPGENKVYIYTKTSSDWSSKTTSTIVAPQNGGFGNSIALTPDGNTLVIGANGANRAFVYTKDANTSWDATPTLITTFAGPNSSNLGFSVSVSDDSSYIVVGAYSYDIVYVWRRTGATWISNSLITISGNSSTFFGVSVAISGDSNTIVIGAYAGVSAYIFTKLSSNNWSTSLTLANATSTLSGPANSAFGNSVAISGDYNTIVVGAYLANNAYVYSKSTGSSWSVTPSVSSTLYGPASSWFGAYVGISSDGNNIVVGAISNNVGYIYSKLAYTWASYPAPIPTSSMTGPSNAFFGKSVAISGDSTTVVIGATNTSTAYIYTSYLSNFIGIGNNTPNFTLDVSGSFHVMSNSGSYARIEADTNAPDIYSGIEFGIPAFSSAQRAKIISYTNLYNASGIRFDVHRGANVNANDVAEQAITIGGDGTLNTYFNGNIGIGLSSANINTNAKITLAGPNVANQIEFQNLDAVADSKKWAMGPNGNIFYIYTAKDDYSVTTNAIQFHRNLNTIQYVNFPNGNIGIGTLTPSNKLQIRQDLGTSDLYFSDTIHRLQFEISKATDNRSMAFGVMDDGVGVIIAKEVNVGYKNILLNPIGGNIGIGIFGPSYKLHVGGDIYATGDITALSDINAKKDITTITNAMDKVNKLRGVYYTTIETDKKCIGLIAQETRDIIPEVVSDISGNIGISYGNIVGLLVEALKESDIKINELKNKNEALEKRLELLEKLLLNN